MIQPLRSSRRSPLRDWHNCLFSIVRYRNLGRTVALSTTEPPINRLTTSDRSRKRRNI